MSEYEMIAGIIAVAIIVILILIWRTSQSSKSYREIPKIIRNISKYHLKSVLIPDAVEGSSYIDWVVLTPKGILVINQKPYKGIIFASENISHWTQVIDKKSYSFDNPLRQLEIDLVTIKSLLPNITVKGYVVFDRDSFFPKGKPKEVFTIKELKQKVDAFAEGEITEDLLSAWNSLKLSLQDGAEAERRVDDMNTSSNYS